MKNIKLMDKIWFINDSDKIRYYHTEKSFRMAIKKVNPNLIGRTECGIYTLTEKSNISEFIKSQDRDKSIRGILGQLSESEKVELDLKSKVDRYLDIVFDIDKERCQKGISNFVSLYHRGSWYSGNTKCLNDKLIEISQSSLSVSNLIKTSVWKPYVFGYSDSVEYYESLLGIHNFKSLDLFQILHKNKVSSKIKSISLSESYHENFKIAKSNLKK